MSLQRVGPKKIRRYSQMTGLDLDMVWAGSGADGAWRAARTIDEWGNCHHWEINVQTGEYRPDEYVTETRGHMSSCPHLKDVFGWRRQRGNDESRRIPRPPQSLGRVRVLEIPGVRTAPPCAVYLAQRREWLLLVR